jgi:hypothetical protein
MPSMGQILFFLNDTFAINLIRTLEAENKTRGDLYFFRKLSPKTLQLEVTCHTTSKRNEKIVLTKAHVSYPTKSLVETKKMTTHATKKFTQQHNRIRTCTT